MIHIKKITIKDVAKEAGVSISTVSNALNGVDLLNPDTRDRIIETANRMNYIPNLNGKNLKSSSTKVIGLFITSIQGFYYGTLANAIFRECDKNGYALTIHISHDYNSVMSIILGKRVDGAIILHESIQEKQVEVMEKSNVPVVFLDREKSGKTITSVVFDSYRGGAIVGKYLMNLGHKRIGYIHGYHNTYDDFERFKGFQNAILEYGLELNDDNVLDGYFEEEASFNAIKAFVHSKKKLPDAFFAANDLSAIGCIKALISEGISVPEDISVIGYDDIDICDYFNPTITTVNNPISKQGTTAVSSLLDIIRDGKNGVITKLDGRLVVRNSCIVNRKITEE